MTSRVRTVLWSLCALVTSLMSGCGSSQPRQAPLTFPAAVSAQSYSTTGAMGPGIGQDPAEMAAINPFDPIALNNLAVLEASRGRYQQAASLLQRAVKLAPARADIAVNLANLQRWLAQAEGQAALGLSPQPLQLPYQESGVPEVPPLWVTPPSAAQINRPGNQSPLSSGVGRPSTAVQPEQPPRLSTAPMLSAVPPGTRAPSR